MVAIAIAAVGLIVLVVALFRGQFNFDIGDSFWDGWPIEIARRDNPWGYWIGIALMIAVVVVAGLFVAANYGIHIVLPKL